MNDNLNLVNQVFDLARHCLVGRWVAPQPIGKQYILKFFHEHRQHPVGVGYGKGKPFRTAEPHEAVGKPVRIETGKYSYGRQ